MCDKKNCRFLRCFQTRKFLRMFPWMKEIRDGEKGNKKWLPAPQLTRARLVENELASTRFPCSICCKIELVFWKPSLSLFWLSNWHGRMSINLQIVNSNSTQLSGHNLHTTVLFWTLFFSIFLQKKIEHFCTHV